MERVEENKARFIEILKRVDREDCNIDALIKYLEGKEFFTAPFSTKYHNSYSGGLCKHCLDVYEIFNDLVKKYLPNTSENTIIILGLLFNIYKIDMYEKSVTNTKVYSDTGSKSDSLGKFDWVSTMSYKVRDAEHRTTFGDAGFTTCVILSRFIALFVEELTVLANGHCGMDNGYTNKDLSSIMAIYPLTTLLHSANLMCTYLPSYDKID